MKLRQNAKELVLVQVEGLGLLLGEIRYNRQTETVLFALEKSAFFDLYFPCAVIYDQERGPVVQPHVLTALTTSSIRVQRSRISCFVLEDDLNPLLGRYYRGLLDAVRMRQASPEPDERPKDEGPEKTGPKGPRVVPFSHRHDKH